MVRGSRQSEPLTPTLSPQGRGGERAASPEYAPAPTSPLRGEVDAQRRVRGSVAKARSLRSNSTEAERKLWRLLRGRQLDGHKFVRQLTIGRYVADFVCREAALVIEVDGGQHAQSQSDALRTACLNSEGYSVLRFWNNEVLGNIAGIHDAIMSVLALNPLPDLRYAPAIPFPQGRGKSGARAASTKTRSYRLHADQIQE